jgi:hypothetical protein
MDNQAIVSGAAGYNAQDASGKHPASNGDEAGARNELRSGGDMVMRGVTGFGDSVLTLAELQARLASVELKQNLQAARAGAFLALSSGVAIFAGLMFVLAGIAELLVSELGMRRGFAFLSIAAFTVAAGAGCLALAASRLRAKHLGFPLSIEELARNLNWLRTVLRQSGRR